MVGNFHVSGILQNVENEPLSVFEDMFITRSGILEGAFISTHMADFHVSGIPETWNGLLEYAMPGIEE